MKQHYLLEQINLEIEEQAKILPYVIAEIQADKFLNRESARLSVWFRDITEDYIKELRRIRETMLINQHET